MAMIKFLGHTMEEIDGKFYFNGECVEDNLPIALPTDVPGGFAPEEAGESCLMASVNEPDFATFLAQKNFLEKVYELMME